MSDVVNAAAAALSEKLSGGLPGSAQIVLSGEGEQMTDGAGVRAGDDEAAVTITAARATSEGPLSGDVHPTAAFMQGKLSIDGDMGLAMQLGAALG